MKVTILVTNYNYDKWLRRCIRSCINQNFDSYEIIIVDDCSTDNSKSILVDYSDNPKIKIIYNKTNLGVGGSCNVGVRSALGKYIVRVDADDYIHEDFLKCLYLYASFNNTHGVACDYQIVDNSENVVKRLNHIEEPVACGILFKTDTLEYLGSYNSTLRANEERDLLKRFIDNGYEMNYLHIPLYRYYKHENSISTTEEYKNKCYDFITSACEKQPGITGSIDIQDDCNKEQKELPVGTLMDGTIMFRDGTTININNPNDYVYTEWLEKGQLQKGMRPNGWVVGFPYKDWSEISKPENYKNSGSIVQPEQK